MSILIVGGAGCIGSQPAKRVAQAGLEPVVLDGETKLAIERARYRDQRACPLRRRERK